MLGSCCGFRERRCLIGGDNDEYPEGKAGASDCAPSSLSGGFPRFSVPLLAEMSNDGSRNAVASPFSLEMVIGMASQGASTPVR